MKRNILILLMILIIIGTVFAIFFQIDKSKSEESIKTAEKETTNNESEEKPQEKVTIAPGLYKVIYEKVLDNPTPSGLTSLNFNVELTINEDGTASLLSGDGMALIEDSIGTYTINDNQLRYIRNQEDEFGEKETVFVISNNKLELSTDYFVKRDYTDFKDSYVILTKK